MSPAAPKSTPPTVPGCLISFPAPKVLLVTINRPKQMNSVNYIMHWQLHQLFQWFDAEPDLYVAVITGSTACKAFCAGQDLLETKDRAERSKDAPWLNIPPPSGFAGLSRRLGKKPVIAAVNGYALGGGFEIVLNCDLAVASPGATFGLPETLRGIYAGAGGLPRLIRECGLKISSEIAMTGRRITAQEAVRWNLINKISQTSESLVDEAVQLAESIAKISPDATIVTKAALRESWETGSVERAFQLTDQRFKEALMSGPNAKEGLAAFAEKRQPQWLPSKI
ncbi:uncharacterized protein Z520_05276 [Fonsecaea multimorphosa CBS 102226]|uniref:Enoyl-CoA hydratase n=1 Tax=Fonsecaea multimorphosa CBS 102226 TaxID=1442371 RepID=A0A0D2HAB5_9EURO|nr:uncharacterized protein Z520_05276 [Fonsecaea multimorphosa CBS 102226]KIX98815.1 hypothetical protein Z520_05276 [Fonsecaea multimorphosa CBS 102226]OAL25095.1 hypothetical protein AYO22_04972 [Fonsecaea multimorphosa]